MRSRTPDRKAETPPDNRAANGVPRAAVGCAGRVLLVEDHGLLARALRQGLQEEGFLVEVVTLAAAGLRERVDGCDVVILDLLRDRESVLDLLRCWRGNGPRPRVLALTEPGSPAAEADASLAVPFAFADLLARLRSLTEPGSPDPGRITAEKQDCPDATLR